MAFRSDLEAIVLGVLAIEPAHGYEIVQRISVHDPEVLSAGEGQIYPVLHSLENEGLLESAWEQVGGRPPRKVYSLSAAGRKRLEQRKAEWRRFRSAVAKILGGEHA